MLLLKKSGGMTVEELSANLAITPMGVRQHLSALEKKDLISHITVRQGVGRPGFKYRLSDRSDHFFPRSYATFALDILKGIEEREGREKVKELFSWRNDKILSSRKGILNGSYSLADQMEVLSRILDSEGYIANIVSNDEAYIIRQFNCPIAVISKTYPEVCRQELALYQELFGENVTRTSCQSKGEHVCEYVVPAAENIPLNDASPQ